MQSDPIKVGQIEIRYLIDGAAHAGMGVFELTVPAGSNVPSSHSHSVNEECVYVLEETLRYSVDADTGDFRPGDWMRTPRGSVHGFSNPHDAPARALIVLTSDIGAQFSFMTSPPSSMPAGHQTAFSSWWSWHDIASCPRRQVQLAVPEHDRAAVAVVLTGLNAT